MKKKLIAAASVSALLLTACGGNEASSPAQTAAPAATAAQTERVMKLETEIAANDAGKEDPRKGAPFDRKVDVSSTSDGTYIRPEPSPDTEKIKLIPQGEIITVYDCSTPGWFYTTYEGTSGFINAEDTKQPDTQSKDSSDNNDKKKEKQDSGSNNGGSSRRGGSYIGRGRVDVSAASAGIYLRPYCDLDAEYLALIPKNNWIDLYDSGDPEWYYTTYDGKEGYVYADYISFSEVSGGGGSSGDFIGYGVVSVSSASAGIYLRPYCDLDAEYLALIPKNLSIPLYDAGDPDWYYTNYDGQWGYVYADYVAR